MKARKCRESLSAINATETVAEKLRAQRCTSFGPRGQSFQRCSYIRIGMLSICFSRRAGLRTSQTLDHEVQFSDTKREQEFFLTLR